MKTSRRDRLQIGGLAIARIEVPTAEADQAIVAGMTTHRSGRGPTGVRRTDRPDGTTLLEGRRANAFTNQGLEALLDSLYADLAANRITHIGLSGDASAAGATTTTLGTPASIKPTANTSRSGRTVSADQTWTQADVAFAIRKIGLLTGDAATDVVNIIGGSGAAPFNEPFTIDLTTISTWTLTMGVDVTATAS